jgi:hypothetical protein
MHNYHLLFCLGHHFWCQYIATTHLHIKYNQGVLISDFTQDKLIFTRTNLKYSHPATWRTNTLPHGGHTHTLPHGGQTHTLPHGGQTHAPDGASFKFHMENKHPATWRTHPHPATWRTNPHPTTWRTTLHRG